MKNGKRISSKILVFLLSFLMVFTLIPIEAFAADLTGTSSANVAIEKDYLKSLRIKGENSDEAETNILQPGNTECRADVSAAENSLMIGAELSADAPEGSKITVTCKSHPRRSMNLTSSETNMKLFPSILNRGLESEIVYVDVGIEEKIQRYTVTINRIPDPEVSIKDSKNNELKQPNRGKDEYVYFLEDMPVPTASPLTCVIKTLGSTVTVTDSKGNVLKKNDGANNASGRLEIPVTPSFDQNGNYDLNIQATGNGLTTKRTYRIIKVGRNNSITGICGDNASWTLQNGTLTITGTGKIWGGYLEQFQELIKCIVIENGITEIANYFYQRSDTLEELILPDSLTKIGKFAFYDCQNLKKVKVPVSVTDMGDNIFSNCKNLTSATVSNLSPHMFAGCKSLKTVNFEKVPESIPDYAFYACGFETLEIPEGVKSIGSYAFAGNNKLTTVVVPSTITELTGLSFVNCPLLENVKDDRYTVKDGILQSKDGKELVLCIKNNISQFNVPKNVETISAGAFWNQESLLKINIPGSVKKIGARAFESCTQLTSIKIPEGVQEINEGTFFECTKLKTVSIPKSVRTVGKYAFYGCSELTKMTLPDEVTTLGDFAFKECSKLYEINIPSKAVNLGENVFQHCILLRHAVIPDGVTEVPDGFLNGCKSLQDIVIPSSVKKMGFNAVTGMNSSLKYVYFKGSVDEWNAIQENRLLPKYYYNATWVYNYGNIGDPKDAPKIVEQPQCKIYTKDADATNGLSVKIEPVKPGETIEYSWYKNAVESKDGGMKVNCTVSEDGLTSCCTPNTKVSGNSYYYCLITKTDAEGMVTTTYSDFVNVVVKLDEFEGDGTEKNPYLLKNLDDLIKLGNIIKGKLNTEGMYFRLQSDIQLPQDWQPIGVFLKPSWGTPTTGNGRNIYPFGGTFDGNNHTITVAKGGQPLFGYVREATVKNLNIYGEYIASGGLVANYTLDYGSDGDYNSGIGGSYISGCPDTIDIINVTIKSGTTTKYNGLIGAGGASGANTININSCKAEKNVKIGWDAEKNEPSEGYHGSFAGHFNGTAINCISYADVYGTEGVGGIIGAKGQSMGPTFIRNCQFYGNVIATGNFAGGILGSGYDGSGTAPNTPGSSVENCIVGGTVSGNNNVGGIFGGEKGQEQAWGNSYICNNVFNGKVKAAEKDAHIGGIVGHMNSLNKHNIIENNYYSTSCGTDKGIGGAKYVDTSKIERGWKDNHSIYYMNTGVDDLSLIKKETNPDSPYINISKSNENRTDDPLGRDLSVLATPATAKDFSSGKIVKQLNEHNRSFHNWIEGKEQPEHSKEALVYAIKVSGEYKNTYQLGEELNLDGMVIKAEWTDGNVTYPDISEVKVTGYDKNKRGIQEITIMYGAGSDNVKVRVLKPDNPSEEKNNITVSFTLYGDQEHDSDSDHKIHTLGEGNLKTWIPKTEYVVDHNATVKDVLDKALDENFASCDNPSGNYVKSITFNGITIGEFTNGKNSGWMYELNGKHPDLGVLEQYLNDGDEIIFHYTDDYTKEEGSEGQYRKEAEPVIAQIDALGKISLESEKAIKDARAAYDALSENAKAKVDNISVLQQAEKKLAELKESSMNPKGNWKKDSTGWWYSYEKGGYPKNELKKIGSETYYFDGNGYMQTGWQKISNKWYYFDGNGYMQTGWEKISGKWHYFDENGCMQTGWQKISDKWYFFDGNGYMQTGWQKISGKWHYFNGNGYMQTGWQKISNKWYYFDGDGYMQTGWQKISGKWHFFNGDGYMQTGWQKISDKWYYFDGDGYMQTGWQKISGKWYYFDSEGYMKTGWQKISKKSYFFYADGHMAANEKTPDGYYVDGSGAWVK